MYADVQYPRSDFNPRSPWGERRVRSFARLKVSIAFQSTLPVGGATGYGYHQGIRGPISIHAPRGGSDHLKHPPFYEAKYFNPRSPWGERR